MSHEIPGNCPAELLACLESSVCSLLLNLDESLARISEDLDLSLCRSFLASLEVLELLHEEETVVAECEPALSVCVDLSVLLVLVKGELCRLLLELEIHSLHVVCRGRFLCVKEKDTAVRHA